MLVLLVFLALAACGLVAAVRRASARRWTELAAGLGGRHEIARRGLWRKTHQIAAQLGERRLLVAHDPRGAGGSATRLILPAPGLAEASLVLARERDLAWSTQLELVDTCVGDEVFDARFKLVSDEPARIRLWLDLKVRRALRVLYGWRLVVDGGVIVFEHEDHPPPLEEVRAAVEAAVLLADSENRWRQRWYDVAPFLDARRASHDPPRLEVIRDGTLISIEPRLDGEAAFVRVRAELARADAAPARELPGVEPDRDALERAVAEVAREAHRALQGPYR
jgi:hypothetical protein